MTSKLNPQADVFDPIAKLLLDSTEVPSFFGAKHLSSNVAPPRYVWVPTIGVIEGSTRIGDHPRSLADVRMTFEVHCWAGTFDAAWILMAALISAIRQECGANYSHDFGQLDALPTEDALRGWILTVPVTLTLPLYEEDLDQPTYTTAKVLHVALDDSQGVDGDGVLIAPLK